MCMTTIEMMLSDVLNDLEEFLEVDGSDGPRPNTAMRLLGELCEALALRALSGVRERALEEVEKQVMKYRAELEIAGRPIHAEAAWAVEQFVRDLKTSAGEQTSLVDNRALRKAAAALTSLEQDARRWRACLELGFPTRNQTPATEAQRWTMQGIQFGATPTEVIDAALAAQGATENAGRKGIKGSKSAGRA
jgi:hypothetical protein